LFLDALSFTGVGRRSELIGEFKQCVPLVFLRVDANFDQAH
jgi:hypothetical protein